jgi:hypothetical protein
MLCNSSSDVSVLNGFESGHMRRPWINSTLVTTCIPWQVRWDFQHCAGSNAVWVKIPTFERHASFILPSNMYSTEDWYIQAPVSVVSLQRFPFVTFTLKAVVFSCEVRMSEDLICLIRAWPHLMDWSGLVQGHQVGLWRISGLTAGTRLVAGSMSD